MKTPAQIRAKIQEIESDERYREPPAQVQINAPLALVQVELKATVRTLKWMLKDA